MLFNDLVEYRLLVLVVVVVVVAVILLRFVAMTLVLAVEPCESKRQQRIEMAPN